MDKLDKIKSPKCDTVQIQASQRRFITRKYHDIIIYNSYSLSYFNCCSKFINCAKYLLW